MGYEHTQFGYRMLAVHGAVLGLITLMSGRFMPALVAGVVLVPVAAIFTTLTTTIRDGVLECRFGLTKWPRTTIRLRDVASARTVRNSPFYGWGIRYTPQGRLWNVWGLDAVELQLRDGRRFRVGTDEPHELLNALARAGVTSGRR